MTTLVTGGAGFIGSHLCERLVREGKQVLCVDNLLTGSEKNIESLKSSPNFRFLMRDVIKPLEVSEEIEAVYHLASPASPNHHSPLSYHSLPMETMLVNTIGTLELLKLAQKHKARFLFASTSEAYGDPKEHPQKEDYRGNVSTVGPRSVYDEAKRFGETMTAYFFRTYKLPVRIARIFNTYGPRMMKDDMRMIVIFINQALKNEPLTIFGDGMQTRSLCYVDDTVEGLIAFMNSSCDGEVINIGSPDEHTVLEYAQFVKKATGSKSEIVFSERLPEDDPLKRRPDITKAKRMLQWSPRVPFEEGLTNMIEYVKKNA